MQNYFRLVRSGIFWAVFFLQAFLLALFIPFIDFFLIRVDKKKRQILFSSIIKYSSRIVLRFGLIKVKLFNLQNIPKEGSLIVAANHNSFLDNIILLAYLPFGFKFLADSSGFTLPFFSRIYKALGFIKVNLKMKLKYQLILYKALMEGEKIVIYSSVGRNDGIPKFRDAIISFSKETNSPILPVCIEGSSKVLQMRRFILRNYRVDLNFGRAGYFLDTDDLRKAVEDLCHGSTGPVLSLSKDSL